MPSQMCDQCCGMQVADVPLALLVLWGSLVSVVSNLPCFLLKAHQGQSLPLSGTCLQPLSPTLYLKKLAKVKPAHEESQHNMTVHILGHAQDSDSTWRQSQKQLQNGVSSIVELELCTSMYREQSSTLVPPVVCNQAVLERERVREDVPTPLPVKDAASSRLSDSRPRTISW
eukprot:463399-Amphidinium_carterae.1